MPLMIHFQRSRSIAAFTLLLAPYLAMAGWLCAHQRVQAATGYLIAAALAAAALAWLARSARLFFLLHFPLFVVATVFTAFAFTDGDLPSYPIAFVLMTTSWEEVSAFFTVWQYQRVLWAALAVLVAYGALAACLPRRAAAAAPGPFVRRAGIGAFAVLAAVSATDPIGFIEGMALSPLVGIASFAAGPLAEARLVVKGNLRAKVPYAAARLRGEELHVLIIGESSRRDSWSVYGYGRPTTPYLESVLGETILLGDAVADANATVYAVPMVLTGMNPEQFSMHAIHGNLIDLAKEAGYSTSWFVNNDASISYLLGMNADNSEYPHSSHAAIPRATPPDGLVLPSVLRQMGRRGVSQFIGLHLFGSHMGYSHRYPPGFARYGAPGYTAPTSVSPQVLLDTYDNTLLYMDWIFQQIIEAARKLDVPVTVSYISDHGEELPSLDGRSGHGFAFYTPKSFEVPAFVWMNAAYRVAHPDKVMAMTANRNKEIRSYEFFYSEADLMGIRWPGFVPARSFASMRFTADVTSRHIAAGNLVARIR